jgi:hypothetical protein
MAWDDAKTPHIDVLKSSEWAAMVAYIKARADAAHAHAGGDITSGTVDGDRLPAISQTKAGAVPATGVPSGKVLYDDGNFGALPTDDDTATVLAVAQFELLFAYKTGYNNYMEYTQVGDNITAVNYWTSAAKTTPLFTKTITYSGDNPTVVTITDLINSKVLTTTIAYSGDDVSNVTKVMT